MVGLNYFLRFLTFLNLACSSTEVNEQDSLRTPKLASELAENTLSMQGIAVTGSYSDIMSGITKFDNRMSILQDVNCSETKPIFVMKNGV